MRLSLIRSRFNSYWHIQQTLVASLRASRQYFCSTIEHVAVSRCSCPSTISTLFVCFLKSPQGFPLEAFLPMTYHNFCSACSVTVVIFGHLNIIVLLSYTVNIACSHVTVQWYCIVGVCSVRRHQFYSFKVTVWASFVCLLVSSPYPEFFIIINSCIIIRLFF